MMAKAATGSIWPRLRLRTILFGVLLFTAAVPLLGVIFLRIYENVLVRQTESELIMQGAVMAAAYAQAVELTDPAGTYGLAISAGSSQRPASLETEPSSEDGAPQTVYTPVFPEIDLSTDPILDDRAPGRVVTTPPSSIALNAAQAVEPVLLNATLTTLASARLLDIHGNVIAGRSEVGTSLAHVPEVMEALAGRHASALRKRAEYLPRYHLEFLSRASNLRVFYARPVAVENRIVGAVLLARSPRTLFRGIYQDIGKLAIGGGVVLLVVLVLAAILSRSITRPIALLNDATRRIARGERILPAAPPTAAREIAELFSNFRSMADTIETRSTYIRDFAAAVSHEFKTPLTGIRGAIELLQEHGAAMAPDERERFFSNLSHDADRLSRLVTRLLELARADVLETSGETIEVTPILKRLAHQEQYAGCTIELVAADDLPPVTLAYSAIETVLVNLIANSRQHGARLVQIICMTDAEYLRLQISDDGKGIAPADRARLFTPFFTTRRERGGTGLGLAIARSLLRAYGATIALAPANGTKGATFVLTMRRADTLHSES